MRKLSIVVSLVAALVGPGLMSQTAVAQSAIFAAGTTNKAKSVSLPLPAKATGAVADENYGKLPISFEANQGQTDKSVKFLARGQGYGLFLTGKEAVLTLHASASGANEKGPAGKPSTHLPGASATDVIRMQLIGANAGAEAAGVDPLPGTANYFIGSDSSKWHTNVPTYSKVRFPVVYPGVDLVYYGNQQPA